MVKSKPKSKLIKKKLTTFKTYEQTKILKLVFEKLEFKDLIKINSVNKQWNELINPICKQSLRLTRPLYITHEYHPPELIKADKLNLEVRECISTNEKYSRFIIKFKWNTNLSNNLTSEFFSKFCNLTHLFINKIKVSQDLILTVLEFLKKLKILSFKDVTIKEIILKRIQLKKIKLTSTLNKLEFNNVKLIGNPSLFMDSINSHKKIGEISYNSDSDIRLIEAIKDSYPSLVSLKITSDKYKHDEDYFKILGQNPQLKTLEYHSNSINQTLLNTISTNLNNLEELIIRDITGICNIKDFNFNFNFPKLKKLTLYLTSLNLKSFELLLLNSTKLEELHLALSQVNWRDQIKLISQLCSNLTHLTYHIPRGVYSDVNGSLPVINSDEFLQFIEKISYKSSNSLRSLSLSNIPPKQFKIEHFSNLPNLTIINFRNYTVYLSDAEVKEIRDYFKQFSENWKLKGLKNRWASEGYLVKLGNLLSPLDWNEYDRW